MKIFSGNTTIYKDDSGHVILTLQDIPIRAGEIEEGSILGDENYDPDEIVGYITVAADNNEE